jgi:glycosyltransferase involved in cell wall biosynthesis
MQPRKNLSTLIEAFNKIHCENKNIKLVLAGGKGHNYDTSIDSTIKKYSLEKEVLLPGFIDEEDKPALYKLAEIFVFPSLYEGFGIPILEAMVSNLPVIASDIPPHKEIAGNTILFFNPQDFKDLAEKIKLLLENPDLREELARLRQEQVKKFSWKRSAEKFLNVLNSGS